MYVCIYVCMYGYDPLAPSHETKALEDLLITLLEDEHGNFHLKNLSMHQVTYIHIYNIHTFPHILIIQCSIWFAEDNSPRSRSLPGRSLLPLPIFLCYALYGLAQMDYSASNSAGLGAGWLRC